MADIRIKITADTAGAIDSIENLQKAGDVTGESLSQVTKQLTKAYQTYNTAMKSGTADDQKRAQAETLKVQQKLFKAIELENSAILMQNRGLKDIEQSKSKILALSKQIAQSTGDTGLAQEVGGSASALQERINEAERAKEAERKLNEEIKQQMALFTGDKVTTYTAQYQKLEAELRAVTKEYVQLDKKSADYSKQASALTGRAEKLSKEMNKLQKEIKEAGKVNNSLRIKNLLKSFISAQAIVWGVRTAVRTLKNTLLEAAEAASHAEETANLFNTTFGDVSYTANNVASSMSAVLGLAKSTSQEMLGLYGDMAAGYGQTQSAALAFSEQASRAVMDIASFKNLSGDMTTLAQTFASGLSGNFENFRKWGVIVTQTEVKARLAAKGLDKLTGSEYQFAKVQETLAIVTEKTANAQGDMVKTLNSTENINRRLTEANKALLETMGSSINTVLNPIKKVWIEIANSITKASDAQKQYAAGVKDIKVYDIAGNASDRKDFRSSLGDAAFGQGNYKNMSGEQLDTFAKRIDETMTKFGATSEDVIREMNTFRNPLTDELIAIIKEIGERLDEDIKAERSLAAREETISNSIADARNLFDQLSGFSGVSLNENMLGIVEANQKSMAGTDKGANNAVNLLANSIADNIELAIEQLTSANEIDFLSPVELALGKVSAETDGLNARIEQTASLYELIYNYSLKDGKLTDEENKKLERILEHYKEQNKLLEERKNLETINAQLGTASEYGTKIDDQRLQDSIRAMMEGAISGLAENEIARQQALISNTSDKNNLMALTSDPEKLAEIEAYYAGIANDIEQYYDILKANIEAEDRKNKLQEVADFEAQLFPKETPMRFTAERGSFGSSDALEQYNEALAQINASMDTYEEKLLAAGSTEEEASTLVAQRFSELEQAAFDAAEALDKEKERNIELNKQSWWLDSSMADAYDTATGKRRTDMNELDEEAIFSGAWMENLNGLMSGMGEFGQLAGAFQQMSSLGTMAGLVGILVDLVTQTEAFTQLASILTDSVLPVLNAFLEPLLPVISTLSGLFQSLVAKALYPMFPVLKALSKALVVVVGLTDIVVGFISDSVKKVTGTIVYGVTELINKVIRIVNKLPFVNIGTIDNQWAKDWMDTDIMGNAEKKWDKMVDSLASIDKMSMEIADNTSEDKSELLKLLKEQYDSGFFTMDEYAAQVADITGKKWDNVKTIEGASYYNGNGTRYVNTGDVNVNINGSNLSEEELIRAVRNALEQAGYPGKNTWTA